MQWVACRISLGRQLKASNSRLAAPSHDCLSWLGQVFNPLPFAWPLLTASWCYCTRCMLLVLPCLLLLWMFHASSQHPPVCSASSIPVGGLKFPVLMNTLRQRQIILLIFVLNEIWFNPELPDWTMLNWRHWLNWCAATSHHALCWVLCIQWKKRQKTFLMGKRQKRH